MLKIRAVGGVRQSSQGEETALQMAEAKIELRAMAGYMDCKEDGAVVTEMAHQPQNSSNFR
jgi:hypothetical protein